MTPTGRLTAMLQLDLDALRRPWWLAPTILAAGLVVALPSGKSPFAGLAVSAALAGTLLPLVVWSRDRDERLDILYGTLPLRRRDVVRARYVEVLVLQLLLWAGLALAAAAAPLAGLALDRPWRAAAAEAGLTSAALVFLWAFALPLLVRFRAASMAFTGGFVFAVIAAGGGYGLLVLAEAPGTPGLLQTPADDAGLLLAGAWLLALALLAGSFGLSVRLRDRLDY